jgi:hypothetical protein
MLLSKGLVWFVSLCERNVAGEGASVLEIVVCKDLGKERLYTRVPKVR